MDMDSQSQSQSQSHSHSQSQSQVSNMSDLNHAHRSSKTGRKGDPRMHRAVAARLADPNLSLFEALKIGGFNYPADDDSSCTDQDQVKLGQRKNQLSRRVRLAKKHGCDGSVKSSGSSHNNNDHRFVGTKHSLLEDDELDDVSDDGGNPSDDVNREQTPTMAKFHPDFHPIIVPPKLATRTKREADNLPLTTPLQAANFFMSNMGMHQVMPNTISQIGAGILNRAAVQSPQAIQNPPFASGVAVASLQQTAASAGMTLEQLALVLQNHGTLAQVLTSSSCGNNGGPPKQFFKSCKDLATAFYKNESRVLYEKVMLQAGFPPDQAREGSKTYLQFAWEAWQQEGQRLQQLILEQSLTSNIMDPPLGASINGTGQQQNMNLPCSFGQQQQSAHSSHQQRPLQQQNIGQMQNLKQDIGQNQMPPPPRSQLNGQAQRSGQDSSNINEGYRDNHHEHNHEHEHKHRHDNEHNHHHHHHEDSEGADCVLDAGRHIHRLEGKCGHKAILHQPPDGTAHIDFVIGDQVECYEGVKPITKKDRFEIGVWPSRYTCEDLSCSDDYCLTMTGEHKHSNECASQSNPKTFNLNDLNFDGKEWNPDFSNDETLVGLFKLGDSSSIQNV